MTSSSPMQLGMVGLGRMGANIVRRLMRDGHSCVVYDVDPAAVRRLEQDGAVGATSMDDFVAKLSSPRAAWVMVPAGDITESTVAELAQRMAPGDIVIDGGNSYYRDDIRRAAALSKSGVHLIDCGTSGGFSVWSAATVSCWVVTKGPWNSWIRSSNRSLLEWTPHHGPPAGQGSRRTPSKVTCTAGPMAQATS